MRLIIGLHAVFFCDYMKIIAIASLCIIIFMNIQLCMILCVSDGSSEELSSGCPPVRNSLHITLRTCLMLSDSRFLMQPTHEQTHIHADNKQTAAAAGAAPITQNKV